MESSVDAVIIPLLPLIIGSALVPVQVIIGILLLKSPQQGLLKASAYIAGLTTLRLLQGLVFGLILTGEASTEGESGKSVLVSTLLMLLGILFLITAFKKWRKEDDPDDPPPKWMAMIDGLTPLKAFGIGMGILLISAKSWVFTLGALGVIEEAQLGQPSSTITFLLFVLLAQSVLLVTLLIRILLPSRSGVMLESLSTWLTTNNRQIAIVVSLVFGLLFFYQGVSGLL